MDIAFSNTFKILANYLLDIPLHSLPSFDLEKSYKIAMHHEMTTVFCAAVLKLCKSGVLEIEPDKQKQLRSLLVKKSIKNGENFEKINKFLKDNFNGKINYAIIKGYSLTEFYPYEEYRESCDTDILIDVCDETKVLKILDANDFIVKMRVEGGNHSKCYSREYGLLELHISLFYETVKNEWFGGFDADLHNLRYVNEMPTLNIKDSFLFLVFHSFKHFVSNVFNLKQFFDIILFLKKYSGKLNSFEINEFLKELKIDNFLSAVLTIAKNCLDLNVKDWYYFEDSAFYEDLIEDMYAGGCYGFEKEKHGDMFEVFYYEKLQSSKGNSAKKTATDWRRKSALKTASFSVSNMKKRYSFVNEKIYMLPVAWLKHSAYIIKTVTKRPKLLSDSINYRPKEIDDLQEKRLEIMKKMGLL